MNSNKTVINSTSYSSVPTISKSGSTANSNSPKKLKKVNSFFKKASIEWNLFLLRIKSLGDEVFSEDQVISELFIDTDSESLLDKLERGSKGYSINEERFLLEYKKFKDLDKMYENYQGKLSNNEEIKSSSTVVSDSNNFGNGNNGNGNNQIRCSLKDVIQSSAGSPLINGSFNENNNEMNELDDDDDDEQNNEENNEILNKKEEEEIKNEIETKVNGFNDDELEEDASNEFSNNLFNDLSRLRKHLENDKNLKQSNQNVGEILWEYRRNQWLKGKIDINKIGSSRLFFDQIPKDSYVKIYNNLIDKGKCLRSDRRINLHDLMKIINAGWVAEEKWEKAARGLA